MAKKVRDRVKISKDMLADKTRKVRGLQKEFFRLQQKEEQMYKVALEKEKERKEREEAEKELERERLLRAEEEALNLQKKISESFLQKMEEVKRDRVSKRKKDSVVDVSSSSSGEEDDVDSGVVGKRRVLKKLSTVLDDDAE